MSARRSRLSAVLLALATLLTGLVAPVVGASPAAAAVVGPGSIYQIGQVGAFSATPIFVFGGTPPYTFEMTSGSLPPGVAMSSGTLVGSPTRHGPYGSMWVVRDSSTPTQSTTFSVVLDIDRPTLSVTAQSSANGTVGQQFSRTYSVNGGFTPTTLALTPESGGLPPGTSLARTDVSSGRIHAITGVPTQSGSFRIDYTGTEGIGYATTSSDIIRIDPPTFAFSPSAGDLPDATLDTEYRQTISASGAIAPYTYAVTAGALPVGLGLSTAGVLSGAPTEAGTFTFTVTSTASSTVAGTGEAHQGSATYRITIPRIVVVSPSTLPGATVGTPYDQTLTASGGISPYLFVVTDGELPAGLRLSSAGRLRGTPTEAGTFPVTVTALDSTPGGRLTSLPRSYALLVDSATVTVGPATVPHATVGSAYRQQLSVAGGVGPHTFTVTSGSLPAGLRLTGAGVLEGTPTAGGTFTFTAQATDASGAIGSQAYALEVEAPTVTVGPTTLPAAARHTAYAQLLGVTGGTGPWTRTIVSGELPPGLELSEQGLLSGTPTRSGSYTFTVRGRDSSTGSGPYAGSRLYTLVVDAPTVTVRTSSLPGATAGTAYGVDLAASGGRGAYAYAVTSGDLPDGLTLSTAGRLAGTPTETGTFPVTLTATDADGFAGSRSLTLTVTSPAPVGGGGGGGVPSTAPILLGEPRDATVRPGADVVLRAAASGQPVPTVQWQVDDGSGWRDLPGAVQPDLALPAVTRAQDGFGYRAVFTNSAGTVTTRAGVLAVGSPPEINRQPADAVVTLGEDAVLTAAATADPAPVVQWQVEQAGAWTDLDGATGATLTLPAVTADQAGSRYRAVFSNGFGDPVASSPATVAVVAAPAVTRQPADRSVRAGGRTAFRADASGLPAPTVQWQVRLRGQWRDVAGATGVQLGLADVRPAWDGRRYRAVFTNAAGTTTTDTAVLEVRRRR